MLAAQILDGNLEGIGFNTGGINNDRETLESLTAKYGKPTKLVESPVQNRMGATFNSISATWNRPDVVVTFESVRSSLESGLVNVDTPKGYEDRMRRLRELTSGGRPL